MSPSHRLTVYLPDELRRRLRVHAARQNTSMSTVLERLIRAELDMADALEAESDREAELIDAITGEHPVASESGSEPAVSYEEDPNEHRDLPTPTDEFFTAMANRLDQTIDNLQGETS